jgi:medium-chain acyl-[acyl-carrier-protein] hydrolase
MIKFAAMTYIQTDTYLLRGYECDARGLLHVPALMNLMQESANRNAADYGISMADLATHGLGWMLMRFRLTMHQYPCYGDTIRVTTYPTFVEKFFIYRDFQVRAADGTLLAEATSTWLVFGQEKRGMVPLPPFIRTLAMPTGVEPLPRLPLKPAFGSGTFAPHREKPVDVGWFSIDTNQHVNNVAYVQWLLETIEPERLTEQYLASLDLVFRDEAHLGNTLSIQQLTDEPGTLRHRVVEGSRELVLAQTNWLQILG